MSFSFLRLLLSSVARRSGLLIFCSCCFLLITEAQAARFSYCGILFNPEELRPVDDYNLLLRFNSEETIVAENDVGPWLMQRLLKSPQDLNKIPVSQLVQYLETCPRQLSDDAEIALLAELFGRKEATQFSLNRFLTRDAGNLLLLQKLFETSSFDSRLKESPAVDQYNLVRDGLLKLYYSDPAWVRSHLSRLFYFMLPAVLDKLKLDLRDFLERSDISSIQQINSVLRSEDSESLTALKIACDKALELAKIKDKEANCVQLSSINSADKKVSEIIYPALRRKITEAANLLIDANELVVVRTCLENLDPEQISPDTFALILRFVKAVAARQADISFSDTLKLVIKAYAQAEPMLLRDYLTLLQSSFSKARDAGDFTKAEDILKDIKDLDSALAVELTYQLAAKAKRAGENNLAQRYFEQIKSELSFFKVLSYRLGSLIYICCVAILLAAVGSLISFKLITSRKILFKFSKLADWLKKSDPRSGAAYKTSSRESSEDEENEPHFSAGSFVKMDINREKTSQQYDYQQKLRKFNLRGHVSLKAIKTAYRNAVKTCHPDLNPNSTEEQKIRFHQLTRDYEELLELRTSLGMIDD